MFAIVSKHKKIVLYFVIICISLPIVILLEEVIFTIGQIMGTVLRMYIEGVCIK